MEFLKASGYYDLAVSKIAQNMYITKYTIAKSEAYVPEENSYDEYSYKETYANYMLEYDAVSKIDTEDAKTLISEYIEGKESGIVSGETYLIFISSGMDSFWPGSNIIEFTSETLPDYLRKYVD